MNCILYYHGKEKRHMILKNSDLMNPYLPDLNFVFRYALLCHRSRNTSTTTVYSALHSIPQSMQLKRTNKKLTVGLTFEAYSAMHHDIEELVTT